MDEMYIDLYKRFKTISDQLNVIIKKILLDNEMIFSLSNDESFVLTCNQILYLFNTELNENNEIANFHIYKQDKDKKQEKMETPNYITWFKNNDKVYLFFKMYTKTKKQYYQHIYLYDMLYRFGLNPIMTDYYNSNDYTFILYNIDESDIDKIELLLFDYFDSYDKKKITKFVL